MAATSTPWGVGIAVGVMTDTEAPTQISRPLIGNPQPRKMNMPHAYDIPLMCAPPSQFTERELDRIIVLAEMIHQKSPRLADVLAQIVAGEMDRRANPDPELVESKMPTISMASWSNEEIAGALTASYAAWEMLRADGTRVGSLVRRLHRVVVPWAAARLTKGNR